jgi:hypothetical protein
MDVMRANSNRADRSLPKVHQPSFWQDRGDGSGGEGRLEGDGRIASRDLAQ